MGVRMARAFGAAIGDGIGATPEARHDHSHRGPCRSPADAVQVRQHAGKPSAAKRPHHPPRSLWVGDRMRGPDPFSHLMAHMTVGWWGRRGAQIIFRLGMKQTKKQAKQFSSGNTKIFVVKSFFKNIIRLVDLLEFV